MARFFVTAEEMELDFLVLSGDNAAHAKVLRLKAGEQVIICDGEGRENLCTVSDVSDGQISLVVVERLQSAAEACIDATIYMAFPKGDKLEHVIQKATELGAFEIVTFPSSRCVSKPDEKSIAKKLERWNKIAASAAEQSGRGRVPKVSAVSSYKEALAHAAQNDLAILFYENERGYTLRNALSEVPYKSIALMTGPEGGLEAKEVEQAVGMGLRVCTLGKRILRCETAPLCALSAVMYDAGEF